MLWSFCVEVVGVAVVAMMTVEEAAWVLRISRTKAYAMANEFRASGGSRGLPVKDLGGVLRVPVDEFEAMFGVSLDGVELPPRPAKRQKPDVASAQPIVNEVPKAPAKRKRGPRSAGPGREQLRLFEGHDKAS